MYVYFLCVLDINHFSEVYLLQIFPSPIFFYINDNIFLLHQSSSFRMISVLWGSWYSIAGLSVV